MHSRALGGGLFSGGMVELRNAIVYQDSTRALRTGGTVDELHTDRVSTPLRASSWSRTPPS
ncbi:MAG: hypothetical protein R3E12_11260 [Candidatus Eisenbacteria bacterium]